MTSLAWFTTETERMGDQSQSSSHQWDQRFMELIDVETWDWWKSQVYTP